SCVLASDVVLIYERKFGNNVALIAVNCNVNTPVSITGLATSLPAGSYTDVLGGLLNGNSLTVGTGGAASNFTLAAGGTAVWQYTTAVTSPTFGHVGPMMAKPGATITIVGRGFGATKGTVFFGSTAVTGANITAWEDTQIKVKIPAVAGGVYNIKLANSAGTSSNVHDNFEVLTGDQVSVRFVVNNATTALGQNVY
ncbi:alpha-amylase, partial [Clostridium perfringens]